MSPLFRRTNADRHPAVALGGRGRERGCFRRSSPVDISDFGGMAALMEAHVRGLNTDFRIRRQLFPR